jgi:alpha-amylase
LADICLGFEVHQPFRLRSDFYWTGRELRPLKRGELFDYYFDSAGNKEIFLKVAARSYHPALEIIQEVVDRFRGGSKEARFFFSLSGTFLEQCEAWDLELVERFRQLAATGRVEFLDQTFHHSLASLWPSLDEWLEQLQLHREAVRSLIGVEPRGLENTELLYNNRIARVAEELGYTHILTEGVERVLKGRSPNYLYQPAGCSRVRLLLRNYWLTDDFGFRFSARWWVEWPLTADKYAEWLAKTPGQYILLFADLETFGEHHWAETGILEFLRYLPERILEKEQLTMKTPGEIAAGHQPVGTLDVPEPEETISWADLERDTSSWLGNTLQWACYWGLRELEGLVKELEDPEVLTVWRHLQTSDHLYYIYTEGGGPGEVHNYFSHYGNPYDAAVTLMAALLDFKARLAEYGVLAKDPFELRSQPGGEVIGRARSLKGLVELLARAPVDALELHMERGDFERWVRESLRDDRLVVRIKGLEGLKGRELRRRLVATLRGRWRELVAHSRLWRVR